MLMFDCDWPHFDLGDTIHICLFGISLIEVWFNKGGKGISLLGFSLMWREK